MANQAGSHGRKGAPKALNPAKRQLHGQPPAHASVKRPHELNVFILNFKRRGTQTQRGSILNFTGPTGIGKTTLVQTLIPDYLKANFPDAIVVLIDFDRTRTKLRFSTLTRVLNDLYRQLKVGGLDPDPSLEKNLQAILPGHRAKSNRRDETVTQFVQYVNNSAQKQDKRIVFIFDTIEDAHNRNNKSDVLFTEIVSAVIEPITKEGLIQCVVASRAPIGRFLPYAVRMNRLVREKLLPFTPEQISQLLPKMSPDTVERIHLLSNGLPIISTALANQYKAARAKKGSGAEFWSKQLRELEKIVDTNLLGDVPPKKRKAFKSLSPLRILNDELVFGALSAAGTAKSVKVQTQRQASMLFSEFQSTQLIYLDPVKQKIVFDPTFRQNIARVQEQIAPEEYKAVHQMAADWYESQLKTAKEGKRADQLVEYLYHRASLNNTQADTLKIPGLAENVRALFGKQQISALGRESKEELVDLVLDDRALSELVGENALFELVELLGLK